MNKLPLAAALVAVLAVKAFARSSKVKPAAADSAAPASTTTFVTEAGLTNLTWW